MSNLIRFQCVQCNAYVRGGPEDKECPLCGGRLTIVDFGVKE